MVGKTSLFTILTGVHESARVGSLEARMGMTKVPDARLDALATIFKPQKITHATVEYLDLPAISKEALRDPSYLASLRVVDAFAHVLRVFQSDTVPHEKGSVDPVRDLDDVETELILSDLVVVEKRLERLDKDRKKIRNPELDQEYELLERARQSSKTNQAAARAGIVRRGREAHSRLSVSLAEADAVVLNLGEEDAAAAARGRRGISHRVRSPDAPTPRSPRSAARSKPSSPNCRRRRQTEYLASYGLKESGLERLISATYSLLGLMCFLTAGETKCAPGRSRMTAPR